MGNNCACLKRSDDDKTDQVPTFQEQLNLLGKEIEDRNDKEMRAFKAIIKDNKAKKIKMSK